MGILEQSPTELGAMTKSAILVAIAAEQDAARAEERVSTVTSQHGDSRGQLDEAVETRDGNGKLIGKRVTTWTYHDRPEDGVRDITTVETDGEAKVTSDRTVRHGGGKVQSIDNLKAAEGELAKG